MINVRMKLRVLPAIACCLVLLLVPLTAKAQVGSTVKQGIQKGGQEVQKGVETGAEKTKEGVEAVGEAGKKAITGEENNPSEQRMKPGETQATTGSTETEGTEKGKKKMPKTAGELPLLALAGWSALSAAGALRILRRKK
jgi:hypothetical protein